MGPLIKAPPPTPHRSLRTSDRPLHFLAQRGYMKDSAFVNYISYLQYWKEPNYVSYIKYPICLYFLELLQHETFRKEIVSGQCVRFLDAQVILHWQHYTRRR